MCDIYETFDLFNNILCLSLFYMIFLQFAFTWNISYLYHNLKYSHHLLKCFFVLL